MIWNNIIVIEFLASESVTIDCESPFEEVTVIGTTITSPNYPNDYFNLKDCLVTIRFAVDKIVAIRFEKFNVHIETRSNEGTPSCHYDYLAVHDGNLVDFGKPSGRGPLISKLCGTSPAGTMIASSGNKMTLHFHTDENLVRSGFKIYATAGK